MQGTLDQPPGEWSGKTVGHYEIEGLIGVGGMGEVYRARDNHLHRVVALKALPLHAATDTTARMRFVREARLACKVQHPYVATVFDVVEHDERLLLVMEYIDGLPLNRLLRDGAPVPERIVQWSLEITEALAAIHRAGMLHRDMKPGNVMITSDGHVKVTDFGLARAFPPAEPTEDSATLTHDQTLTREGGQVGTFLYMSPEQLRGDALDTRSDLFSLGVLLHEVATGVHPFKRGSAAEIAGAILHEPATATDDSAVLRDLPKLRDVLLRLLEKDPADRYTRAEELLEDLRSATSAVAPNLSARRRAGWLPAGVVSAALVIVVVVVGFWWTRTPPVWERPRIALAIAPFADHAGSADAAVEAAMIADLFAADLKSSRVVRVIGPERTAMTLTRLDPDATVSDIARRIASNVKADYVVVGKVYREDDRYRATLAFERSGSGVPEIPAIQSRGNSPLNLADALATQVRRRLPNVTRLTALRDDRTNIEEITSTSHEAREAYAEGVIALREMKHPKAVERFEAALEIDPEFALAQARLAEALADLGYGRRARQAATRALELAPDPDSRATKRLSLRMRAVHADIYSRRQDAVEVTAKLVALFDDEPELLRLHARTLRRDKAYDEALDTLDRAVLIDPLNPSVRIERAANLRLLKRYDESNVAIDEAESLFELVNSRSGLAQVDIARGNVLWKQRRYDVAIGHFEDAAAAYRELGREIDAANAMLDASKMALLQGKAATAGAAIETAEALAIAVGNRKVQCSALSAKAVYYQTMRDYPSAEQAYRQTIDLARQLESASLLSDPLTNLANLLAWLGRKDEARPLLADAAKTAKELGRHNAQLAALAGLGRIEFQLGDLDAAESTYRELLEQADPDRTDRLALRGRFGLTAIHQARGDLSAALETIEIAVRDYRSLELGGDLGDALNTRAGVLALLGRHDAALSDVDEALRIAKDPDAGLRDLEERCEWARLEVRFYTDAWQRAVARARERVASEDDPPEAVVRIACEGSIRLGEANAAAETCLRFVEREDWSLPARVELRAAAAVALLDAGRNRESRDQARLAFDEASRMGMRLEIARAASVLLRLETEDAPVDPRSMRRSAHDALREYLESTPETDRERVELRYDSVRIRAGLADDD